MNFAIRLTGTGAAVLLPLIQPVMLVGTVHVLLCAVTQQPAAAQSAEAVAKVAQAITVRLKGATQGSGVLLEREGNRYTVLTAWHVVSDQKPGEELDIYTSDGQRHPTEKGSIKRLGDVDMAVMNFSSPNSYELAKVGEVMVLSMGSQIYVSGFPLPSSAVPTRLLRFKSGLVEAIATVNIPSGYQLLYSNPTLPGMSGGAVLNAEGQLIGIHGLGVTDSKMTEQEGVAVKTGTNQAVPIFYFGKFAEGTTARFSAPSSGDLYEKKSGNEKATLLEEYNCRMYGTEGRKEQTSLVERYQRALEAQQEMMRELMGR